MQKVNLTKYGFVRTPNEDFSDDGARFYVYHAGRVRVSKTTWNGEIFLAGRIDGNLLNYDVYSKLPHYEALDRLNGVSISALTEDDIKQLYDDCLAYEQEYNEAEKNVVFPTIDELKEQCVKIRKHYQTQQRHVLQLLEQNAVKLILKASEWKLKSIRSNLETITKRANGYDPDTYPQSIQKSCYGINFAKPTNHDLTETWYYDQIVKTINEVE